MNFVASSYLMTRLAEMSSSPAEPNSELTAIHALVLDVLFAMLFAISLTHAKVY